MQAFRLRGAVDREFREFREFREVREALPTFIPKLSTFPKLIKFPNKTPPQSARSQFVVIVAPLSRPNFLSEGVSCGLDKEIALDGTYLKYFPFRAMIERSQMTPYHKKLCDKSLVRCCIKQAINLSGVRHLNLYQPTLAIGILINE